MTEHTHITTPESLTEDSASEPTLRPRQLEEFIGQSKVREALSISIEAAKQRREPLDHILFHGPPGLGKTTLAALLAREMGVNIKTTSGPILEKPADLVGIRTTQRDGDILYIDELHRLRPRRELGGAARAVLGAADLRHRRRLRAVHAGELHAQLLRRAARGRGRDAALAALGGAAPGSGANSPV